MKKNIDNINTQEQENEFWHQMIKGDESSINFFKWSVVFCIVDVSVLLFIIITNALNGAYVAVAFTIGIHAISAYIVSEFYNKNEHYIDEDNIYFKMDSGRKCCGLLKWKYLRTLCQCLAITPLFWIITNWKDHQKNHTLVREQRIQRRPINPEEIQAIVLNKKRHVVLCYFNCLQAYFKTIPQCVLQVYIVVDTNLPIVFCTITEVMMRIVALIYTPITASRATTGYYCVLIEYLKTLQFQDYVTFNSSMELDPPKELTWWVTFICNWTFVVSRLYGIFYLMTYVRYSIFIIILILIMDLSLNLNWIKSSPCSRPAYENPPSGKLTLCSDFIDRYINIFCFHMIQLNLENVLRHYYYHFILFMIYRLITTQTGIFLNDQGLDWATAPVNDTYETDECNSTLLSAYTSKIINDTLASIYGHQQQPSKLKNIFSSTIVVLTLMLGSGVVSIFYGTIYKRWAKLKDLSYPLQNSTKWWKIILNQEWTLVGPSQALKTVILGTIDSKILEQRKYELPDSLEELKGILAGNFTAGNNTSIDVKAETTSQRLEQDDLDFVNDPECAELLSLLRDYLLAQDLRDETDAAMNYFINSFETCMKQMTSYRLDKINVVLNNKNHNLCCLLPEN